MSQSTLFPTKDWAENYARAINETEEYQESGKGWLWDIAFMITELPESVRSIVKRDSVAFILELRDGRCNSVTWVERQEDMRAPFTVSAKYSTWLRVIRGELGPTQAMLTGQLKVKGDISKILRYSAAAVAMVKAAQKVPTRYE
jgi:putative sterol carrier protein